MFFVISGKEETANFYYFLIGWSVLVMAVMLFAEIWNQYKEREEAFIYN